MFNETVLATMLGYCIASVIMGLIGLVIWKIVMYRIERELEAELNEAFCEHDEADVSTN